jgi:hypothetical protein
MKYYVIHYFSISMALYYERHGDTMKRLGIVLSLFALVLLFTTACTKSKTNTETKNTSKQTQTEQTVQQEEKVTPLQLLKETQKKISAISGYKFSRITIEKNNTTTNNNTETGEEQLNPQVAHFTNSKNNEYYYDKQSIYMKKDGQWVKGANKDGKVLVSVLFTNNVAFFLENLGTKEELPGITVTKKDYVYVLTIDYLIFKDPKMTDSEFIASKKQIKTRKTELTVDANTFEPKKYTFHYESLDGKRIRSVDLDLVPYSAPITIPIEVISQAKTPVSQ